APASAAKSSAKLPDKRVIAALQGVAHTTFGEGMAVERAHDAVGAAARAVRPKVERINAKGLKGRKDGARGLQHVFTTAGSTNTSAVIAAASTSAATRVTAGAGGGGTAQPTLLHYTTTDGIDTGVVSTAEAARMIGSAHAAAAAGKLKKALPASVASLSSLPSAPLPSAAESALRRSAMLNTAVHAGDTAPVLNTSRRKSVPESERTALGKAWFNLPAGELTQEMKRDLLILRNREYLDPKRHYKGGGVDGTSALPRFFAVGTVQEGPHEALSQRLTRKQRHPTLVDALLTDERFRQYARKNVAEVAAKARSGTRGAFAKRKAQASGAGDAYARAGGASAGSKRKGSGKSHASASAAKRARV
ncbi:hypothetical protein EON68_01850, partial [archaeon]